MQLRSLGRRSLLRATARGLVAAMAMTGVRTVTRNIGLLHKSPPEAIVERHAPGPMRRLAPERMEALTELAHWSYGGFGGALYGFLPDRIKADMRVGPVYGLILWFGYEAVLAPLLDVTHTEQRGLRTRAMLALDHAMYGVIVAGWMAPEPAVPVGRR